jgi:hypothetical protein
VLQKGQGLPSWRVLQEEECVSVNSLVDFPRFLPMRMRAALGNKMEQPLHGQPSGATSLRPDSKSFWHLNMWVGCARRPRTGYRILLLGDSWKHQWSQSLNWVCFLQSQCDFSFRWFCP